MTWTEVAGWNPGKAEGEAGSPAFVSGGITSQLCAVECGDDESKDARARSWAERCGFRGARGRAAGEAFLRPAGPATGWEEPLGCPAAVMVVGVQPGTEKRDGRCWQGTWREERQRKVGAGGLRPHRRQTLDS